MHASSVFPPLNYPFSTSPGSKSCTRKIFFVDLFEHQTVVEVVFLNTKVRRDRSAPELAVYCDEIAIALPRGLTFHTLLHLFYERYNRRPISLESGLVAMIDLPMHREPVLCLLRRRPWVGKVLLCPTVSFSIILQMWIKYGRPSPL
jgi:hypothetical protein